MITIDVSLSPDLVRNLTPGQYSTALDNTVKQVARLAQGRIAQSPGPSHKPVLWKSDKQRRFYFAMRRKAGLPPQYTRNSDAMSQRLELSWDVEWRGHAYYVVGTRATYARYVQHEGEQSPQHAATGWKTDATVVSELQASGDIERVGNQVVAAAVGR